jgi:hypothetical protein
VNVLGDEFLVPGSVEVKLILAQQQAPQVSFDAHRWETNKKTARKIFRAVNFTAV